MCNCKIVGVKSVSCRGVKVAAIPCGVCSTCRKREQLDWSFRIKTELLSLPENEWYCVFFTMTYNDWNLPHFPRLLLNSTGEEKYKNTDLPMCFSKDDVREFQTYLRYWLERVCGCKDDKRYKWITCAEYGENTKRCHYHTLLCVPVFVDKEKLFEKVCELWTPKGFIFPKNINGGVDKYGYVHKPFVVENIYKAAAYVSKYISKDIAFEESIDRSCFKKQVILNRGEKDEKKVRLSNYCCFHLQSRSLGNSFCKKLNDEQKKEYLIKGFFFAGDEFCHSMPKYFKEKFLFDNYYLKTKDGKRVVRKIPTPFFQQHYKELFENKVQNMVRKYDDFQTNYRYQVEKFASKEEYKTFCDVESRITQLSNYEICEKFIAYAGVDYGVVTSLLTPCEMWYRRYTYLSYVVNGDEYVIEGLEKDCSVLFSEDYPELDNIKNVFEDINRYYFMILLFKSRIDEIPDKLQMENERNIAYIQDCFKSCED